MTVLQNLLTGCHPLIKRNGNILSAGIYWGLSQKTELGFRQLAEEVLDFMELGGFRKRLAGDLPIGTQKLVGVARALCAQPKILLLDEPASGLSRDEKEDLARFLLRIKYEKRIPILWVEHDMTLVSELADRLLVLDHGRKIGEGSPEDVLSKPEVVQIYSGAEI
jgi:branched-chain amino acid transport system ATP-binding protein